MFRLWGVAVAALVFAGPASAFEICPGPEVLIGPPAQPVTITSGDTINWTLVGPHTASNLRVADSGAFAARSPAGARVEVQLARRTVKSLRLDLKGQATFSLRGHGRVRVFMPAAEAGPGYVAGFSNTIRL